VEHKNSSWNANWRKQKETAIRRHVGPGAKQRKQRKNLKKTIFRMNKNSYDIHYHFNKDLFV
jgi:hypothetical protein